MSGRAELKATKTPKALENLAIRNLVAINSSDLSGAGKPQYVRVRNATVPSGIVFSVYSPEDISTHLSPGSIAFSGAQRKWLKIAEGDRVDVAVEKFGVKSYIGEMHLALEFQTKGFKTKERYDTSKLSQAFLKNFNQQVFNSDQPFHFKYPELDEPLFKVTVLNITGVSASAVSGGDGGGQGAPLREGVVTTHSRLTFTSEAVALGGADAAGQNKTLFDKGWKFEDLGVGGLGKQFQEMFRRAFVSRIFPPDVVEKLGITHTKGMMLYGPPGTGKTLMARQIGKMLNGTEPKVVNGPEIMSKFVGQSEENVRKLFADAEAEQYERGDNSQLHIIIFDEIDAICKQRGSTSGGTGVADSVVNQLLAKIDGVDALNNVFLIGMTNRLDMIDEALLRPGRFELKLQIGLPDISGRLEILKIHTKKLRDNGYLQKDVLLEDIAERTKNFSGAEIAGLIRSAVSFATEQCMKSNSVEIDKSKLKDLKVHMKEFDRALAEVRPAFGTDEESFDGISPYGIVEYDLHVDTILQTGKLLVQQVKESERTSLVSLLLAGGPGSGKSSLATEIAKASDFPYVKIITPDKYVGMGEVEKVSRIKKVFDDAYKSPFSAIVVDDIERLIDFNEVGARFSNGVLQALLVLLKKLPPPGHKIIIIATTGYYSVMRSMGVVGVFSKVQHINYVERSDQVRKLLEHVDLSKPTAGTMESIMKALDGDKLAYSAFDPIPISIGVKKLFAVAEMARQSGDPADTFLSSLYDECKSRPY